MPEEITTSTPANDSTAPVNAPAVRRWPRLTMAMTSDISGISDRMIPMFVAEVSVAAKYARL
ncbi:hypothetical protein D3C84_909640 [compost metagenome]